MRGRVHAPAVTDYRDLLRIEQRRRGHGNIERLTYIRHPATSSPSATAYSQNNPLTPPTHVPERKLVLPPIHDSVNGTLQPIKRSRERRIVREAPVQRVVQQVHEGVEGGVRGDRLRDQARLCVDCLGCVVSMGGRVPVIPETRLGGAVVTAMPMGIRASAPLPLAPSPAHRHGR